MHGSFSFVNYTRIHSSILSSSSCFFLFVCCVPYRNARCVQSTVCGLFSFSIIRSLVFRTQLYCDILRHWALSLYQNIVNIVCVLQMYVVPAGFVQFFSSITMYSVCSSFFFFNFLL